MYACMHVCMHASCIYDDRLLPRYSETIFIFFVSVPLQIEKFAKVRTISISFQYQFEIRVVSEPVCLKPLFLGKNQVNPVQKPKIRQDFARVETEPTP